MVLISIIIMAIMAFFAFLGVIDSFSFKGKRIFGGVLSAEFTKGIEMIGSLCLSIVGIITLVPLFQMLIENTITPIYLKLGLDPSFVVSTFFAIDMGGYNIAEKVALDPTVGNWAGIIYASTMGATISFTLPVSLKMVKKDDFKYFLKGVLFGVAALPLGTFVGGLMLRIDIKVILLNMIPLVLFSLILILLVIFAEKVAIKIFEWISKIIAFLALTGLALGIIRDIVVVPLSSYYGFSMDDVFLFSHLDSTSVGIGVAGAVGIVLSGALPFVYMLNKWLKKPLRGLKTKTGGTEYGVSGYLLSAANNMAMLSTFDKMTNKEKVLNAAFAVAGSFVIGDHLAFVGGVAKEYIITMIVSKLISAVIAVLLAYAFIRKNKGVDNA